MLRLLYLEFVSPSFVAYFEHQITFCAGHEADTNDALKKIETTFNVLVTDRGVFDAVRIIIRLLFQDDES